MLSREDAQRLAIEAGFHPDWAIEKCLDQFQAFYSLAIADFLERTGQYVTNDASREAVIAEAVAAERKTCEVACAQAIEHAKDAEREAILSEIETGIWLDKTTEEVLAEIAAAIRARGEKGGAV